MNLTQVTSKLQTIIRYSAASIGIDSYLRTQDREVLETVIFPYLVEQPEFHKILFVGCAWYTKGYNKIFQSKDYYTLEIDPNKRMCGSKKHIIDTVENVRLHFKEGELDLIVCNGVFGWGLNDKSAVEKTFQGFFDCLREGGVFILGWNDVPERRPFPLEECRSIQQFHPFTFPPLGTHQYAMETENRHIYSFYIKCHPL